MGFLLTGYVLEPPRVGQANSPFTFTPNIVLTDPSAFNTHYPSNETAPRTDYLVFPRVDGDLPGAVFCWTKNEVVTRFDYDGKNQRFRPLPGAAPTVAGTVAANLNTSRLKVPAPISTDFSSFPVRLSVGTLPGTQLTLATVPDEGSFTPPSVGTVQVALTTGALNWNTTDLVTYLGESVHFQQQNFFAYTDSTGALGLIDNTLLLNPIPGAGQFPLIRIGFREYLTPIERANEGSFSVNPTSGTVEWARTTGRLKFNSGDVTTNSGRTVYYDGACFAFSLQLVPTSFGTVNSPGNFFPLPDPGADTFFRIPGVVQFNNTIQVETLSTFGTLGTVEIRESDGLIQFSIADRAAYGTLAVQAFVADLSIERGMSLRLQRTPVDPQALDSQLKDVSAFYTTTGAVLADPIIGSPKVLLPAIPDESQPITVTVLVGTGSFVGVLPRLDVPSPPLGLGYVIDFPNQEFLFAERKANVIFPQSASRPYGAVQFTDPAVLNSDLVLELETSPGSNIFTPLTLNQNVTFDFNSGLATLVSTTGNILVSGDAGSFSGTTFTDSTVNYLTAGVAAGDLLAVLSGASKGIYTIGSVSATTLATDLPGTTESNLLYEVLHGQEILADRFFKPVPALDPNTKVERINGIGTITNSPRISIQIDRISVTRFRLGKTTFLTTVTVANDGAFTTPPQGTVQVSLTTGHLNFNPTDVATAATVYSVVMQTLGTDYSVQPVLGFIQFNQRLLQSEEVLVTYAVLDANNNKVVVQERGTFGVRKELTVHPVPTSTLPFNPLERELASVPPARAFRGGRPQVTGDQVTFDYAHSTVTFLPDTQKTNAIPHGDTVAPSERVYIDYFVYEAIGGEANLTVLQPPMLGVTVIIQDGSSSFPIPGDRTAEFPASYLLQVDKAEVYLLAAPTYDSVMDVTTVNLQAPQVFRADALNPSLAVTSGPTRVAPSFLLPAYFVTELTSYETVSRGLNTMKFIGDVSRTYVTGTVVFWTNGADVFDFNVVQGSSFDSASNRTIVTFASNGARQYTPSLVTLKRSSNAILPSAVAVVSTSRSPDLSLPFLVFRRIEGQVGVISNTPDDYSMDSSGRITFIQPLRDLESLVICYTGATVISDGRAFRASYTHAVIPNTTNGLAGQVLTMDYTTYAPDSFYWRVETITTFRGELSEQYSSDAQASIPSGGPRLQNNSGPKLFEQGRESLFFNEEHLANEDLVARSTLKFYNDGINFLEDALESMDGRIVGAEDGRFLFDGNINNALRTSVSQVTNDIDDQLKVADGPVAITFPPFAVTFGGTFKAMWQPSKLSRFYPTHRQLYGVAASGTGLANGDTILDLGFQNLSAVNEVTRRAPWAIVTVAGKVGDTVLQVDNADGALDLLRPPFDTVTYDHRVGIVTQTGIDIIPAVTPVTVTGKTTTSLTLATPLASPVPVGSTIYQVLLDSSPPGSPYPKFYRVGVDVGTKLDDGVLTHIKAYPPLDGTVPSVPAALLITNPAGGEVLDVNVDLFNSITEPYRIPALDGGTHDDDNNRQFPILSPSASSEGGSNVGGLYVEESVVQSPSGTLRTATTPPFVATGNLDATRTIITNIGGPWTAPIPKIFDLVEIRTGLNALSGYRRIVAVGASTITVDSGQAFTSVDSGFTFAVTVSNTLVTGAAGTFTTTTLTDLLADFVAAGVQPGDTVVITTGAFTGLRRQVTQVVSSTVLDITALPGATTDGYRVDNPLGTFGGTNSILATLVTALQTELAELDTNARPVNPYSERQGIEQFFNQFFTSITSGTTGHTIGTTNLTDLSANFVAAGVAPGQFVYIRSGTVAGVYSVAIVNSPTSLDVTTAFPATATGVTYEIATAQGLNLKALQDAFSVLQKIDQAITDTTAFLTLVTTAVTVSGDAGAFGRRTLISDLDARAIEVTSRIAELSTPGTGSPAVLSSVLSSSGKLYDKRYTWIDARINLEKGILPKQQRAVSDRLKAEKDIQKQLIKLLTT